MILCPKLKLAFMHVPKTGGTAISAALVPHLDLDESVVAHTSDNGWEKDLHTSGAIRSLHSEGSIHSPMRSISWEKPDDWFSFAFVRNPFVRWHGLYRASMFRGDLYSFMLWMSEHHPKMTVSQWGLLSKNGEIAVDYVGRFEQFQVCFDDIKRLGKAPELSLPKQRVNVSNGRYPGFKEAWADPKARHLLEEFSGPDFEVFNYSREHVCEGVL